MLFNQTVLFLKQRYLDSTPLDLVHRVAENLADGNAKINEVPRQWTPGGGSHNFIVSLDGRQWFVKAKHKSLFVESALESEGAFSSIPALKNEYSFLCELAASPHVPQVLGFIEQDDYMFLATEVLQPFDVITSFDPPQIVDAFQQLVDFTRSLYAKDIVHTDIHEKNICFRGNVPVLIDFEEARYVRQSVCFEDSLDVSGASGIDNVGEYPALKPDSVRGFTCLNRLKEVFKNTLRPKLPSYLAQCNFDCSSAFNLDVEQQPDSRIYQSVTLPDLMIVGQRPVHDTRLDYVHLALGYAATALERKLDVVDLGANMGMVAFSCAAAPGVRSVVGLEADPRYVEASKVLAFYTGSPASVVFEEYMTGNRPYVWSTDVLLMLSVYHHVADKDAFLQELATKKITCILGEFAVQERYYPQRGSVKAEIEHIRKTLGFKYAEYLAISDDYRRPLVAFHSGPESSIRYGMKRQRHLAESLAPSLKISADKALGWVRAHSVKDGGICVSNKNAASYPEVTGYFIPTLLQWGEKDLAVQYARWLISIQRPDGAFSGPGIAAPFAFDTGQAIRGLAAIASILPEAAPALEKGCQWILRTASSEGRLALPEDMGAWSLGARGHVNEAIHLYVLPGLTAASEVLNTSRYAAFARRSLDYYIAHCNLTNFLAPNMLLHFYCYIQEALFDLGADDICRSGMKHLAEYQADSGFVPAYAGERWVCTPGLIQAGLVWCKLQEEERAHGALRFAQLLQSPSGGFLGGIGEGATYFPKEELSWPIKFWLDALTLQAAGQIAPMQDVSHDGVMPSASGHTPQVLQENEIPVIRLESAAIGELERSCLKICELCTPQSDLAILDGAASSIPVLLDWGRRSQALILARKLEKICSDQLQRGKKIWENTGDSFFLARLLRAFRQPEVLQAHGDAMLRPLCLAVLQRQRQSATDIQGLFSCFNELREAGLALHEQGWVDCARHWAKTQGSLLDQSATPGLVQDSVSVGLLLGPEVGTALLQRIFASVGGEAQNKLEFKREYARMALTLAWGAWTLGDDGLGQTAYCQGVSALMESGGEEKYFQEDTQICLAFLEALRAMQGCRFAIYFPSFMDDISSDDGRLLFVRRHLPQDADSHVLDLGTGKGRYLRRLHYEKNAGVLVGQDVHPAFAGFMPKGVSIGVGTVLRTGWQDESFNAVLLCEVLEHCIDLSAALEEIHRILAADGTLIIVDKNVKRLAFWSGGIQPWEQWFDCADLAELLRGHGFEVAAIDGNLAYEGRQDGLFFGLAARKKFTPNMQER